VSIAKGSIGLFSRLLVSLIFSVFGPKILTFLTNERQECQDFLAERCLSISPSHHFTPKLREGLVVSWCRDHGTSVPAPQSYMHNHHHQAIHRRGRVRLHGDAVYLPTASPGAESSRLSRGLLGNQLVASTKKFFDDVVMWCWRGLGRCSILFRTDLVLLTTGIADGGHCCCCPHLLQVTSSH
jgi:hypothetical protein